MKASTLPLRSSDLTSPIGCLSARPFKTSTLPTKPHTTRRTPRLTSRAPVCAAGPAAAAAISTGPGLSAHRASAWFRAATGVPLVEAFDQLTIQDAALRAAGLIGLTIIGGVVGRLLIRWVSTVFESQVNKGTGKPLSPRVLLGSALIALTTPAQVLLPWACASFGSTVAAAFMEVGLEKYATTCTSTGQWLSTFGQPLFSLLFNIAQLLQDATEVMLLLFVSWTVLRWKDRIVQRLLDTIPDGDDLARVVAPTNTVASFCLITATIFSSLSIAGWDVRPLLALGSAGTIAVGFAAQSVVTNVVSAFSLYTIRPFKQGDHIILKTASGGFVTSGTVQKILPMKTIIVQDNRQPVYINNKDVANMMIVNESQGYGKEAVTDTAVAFDASITVRYEDLDKIPGIENEATEFIKSHPDMLGACRCIMSGFDARGVVLGIKFILKQHAHHRRYWIKSEVLREVERIIRKHGAEVAFGESLTLVQGGPLPSLSTLD